MSLHFPFHAVLSHDAVESLAWGLATMGRWGGALGPLVLQQIHERIVKIAQEKGATTGRRMRVDTTVVETNI